jgi:hypothetical protein
VTPSDEAVGGVRVERHREVTARSFREAGRGRRDQVCRAWATPGVAGQAAPRALGLRARSVVQRIIRDRQSAAVSLEGSLLPVSSWQVPALLC